MDVNNIPDLSLRDRIYSYDMYLLFQGSIGKNKKQNSPYILWEQICGCPT